MLTVVLRVSREDEIVRKDVSELNWLVLQIRQKKILSSCKIVLRLDARTLLARTCYFLYGFDIEIPG